MNEIKLKNAPNQAWSHMAAKANLQKPTLAATSHIQPFSAKREQKTIKMNVEILIGAPFSLLIKYPDENEDIFIENPIFFNIRKLLQIEMNIIQWANECYDILAGKRDLQRIKLFYSKCKKNYILLDNYFDAYDQLDTISIGIKGGDDAAEKLRNLTRMLFDDCEYKICYHEGNGQIFKQYPIDEISKKRYSELPSDRHIKGKKIEIE